MAAAAVETDTYLVVRVVKFNGKVIHSIADHLKGFDNVVEDDASPPLPLLRLKPSRVYNPHLLEYSGLSGLSGSYFRKRTMLDSVTKSRNE